MPLYEYQCDVCGHRFEKIQKFSDPPIDACPSCGGAVKKLVSSPAFQFKGSGWYVTDYARSGSGSSGGGESTGEAGKTEAATEGAGKSDKAEKASETKKADTASDTKPKADK
jgi:putative FmdB family regulatory protein